MKIKYTCENCQKDNIVDVGDLITMGLGRDGVSATELGLGAMFGPIAGFGGMAGRPFGNEIPHTCKHCNTRNMIPV